MDNSVPWEKFREWIHSICIVTFDLELGQALEVIYPGDAKLTTTEKTNVCYLAFPDSNSGNNRDTNFHFRIRRSTTSLSPRQLELSERVAPSLGLDVRYLYGFVHFRQQKDPSIPRGYYQKSLVLLSVLPFFNLFSTVAEQIALQFFDVGEPAIEAACHDIDNWPPPVAGTSFSVPLMGFTIEGRIPLYADLPIEVSEVNNGSSSTKILISSVHTCNLFAALNTALNHVQLLWELVLIGEPLLIIASGPARSCAVVQALVSLICPLKYLNDYRPYFTIHDSEFKEYSSTSRAQPKVILGVTNPFFIKTLDHWPHILKVGDVLQGDDISALQDKTRKTWDGRTLDSKPGLYTQYKPFLLKDKSLMKKILKCDKPTEIQSSVLRRHFLELTQSFMIPLERYISSLMPLRKEMSPFKAIPSTKPFHVEDFLLSIDGAGPSLTCGVKGDWTGLYRKFLSSANFIGWLANRTKDVNCQLKSHYVDMLCTEDLGCTVLSKKHHVEVVDLVLRMRERITEIDPANEKRNLLVKQIVNILRNVDDDLKEVLMSNCSLREIIA